MVNLGHTYRDGQCTESQVTESQVGSRSQVSKKKNTEASALGSSMWALLQGGTQGLWVSCQIMDRSNGPKTF